VKKSAASRRAPNNGHWFCVLHEDAAENLEPNEQDAALDDLLDLLD
jgi:hypothetical protein